MNREVDYLPWTGQPFSYEKFPDQKDVHDQLRAKCNAEIDPTAFISPLAKVYPKSFKLGAASTIAADALVRGDISIGSNSTVNPHVNIHGKVTIGNDVRIASLSTIAGHNHGFADIDKLIRQQPLTIEGIVIEDDVWVGANVVILDGVTVGAHSILAAGAIVTKDVAPYSIVGGNPARLLKDRRAVTAAKASRNDLAAQAKAFGEKVREQLGKLLQGYEAPDGSAYLNQPGYALELRPWCDSIEIAGMFGEKPPLMKPDQLIAKLQSFQDPVTGLFPDVADPSKKPHLHHYIHRYPILAVGYALEVMGSHLLHPVHALEQMPADDLMTLFDGLNWESDSWAAGDCIDAIGSGFYQNAKYFASKKRLEPMWGWLDTHANPLTGVWGKPTAKDKWLQPVNGFYRLTRGTYAQFGIPVPYPVEAIDTILTHTRNANFFREDAGNACNVLDIIHPLWLCRKQTQHRVDEIRAVTLFHWKRAMVKWNDGRGFSFDLESNETPKGSPSLMGTEMWLSIVFLMAEILGVQESLGYRPKGVHRTEVALPR